MKNIVVLNEKQNMDYFSLRKEMIGNEDYKFGGVKTTFASKSSNYLVPHPPRGLNSPLQCRNDIIIMWNWDDSNG